MGCEVVCFPSADDTSLDSCVDATCVSRCWKDSRGKGDGDALPLLSTQKGCAVVFASFTHGIEYFSTLCTEVGYELLLESPRKLGSQALFSRWPMLHSIGRKWAELCHIENLVPGVAVKSRAKCECRTSSRGSCRALRLFLQEEGQNAACIPILCHIAHEVERGRR